MATLDMHVLNSAVVYTGRNFFGRKARLRLAPQFREEPEKSGSWFWNAPKVFGSTLEIEPKIVRVRNRRIELKNQSGTFPVYEHTGVLRFFGLVGVGGLEVKGQGWPPSDGRSIGLWQTVKTACLKTPLDVPLYSVAKTVRHEYKEPRGGRKAFTEIRPATDGKLTLEITRSYKGIGTQKQTFQFPDHELLEQVCASRTVSWPPGLYYPSRLLSSLGWPHHQVYVWPQEHCRGDLIREVVYHAALDILGALSLLCRNGYFIGHVVSECSGHEADINAVLQANDCLIQV